MVDSDHSMQDTVVRVAGPWEVESEDECGAIPIVWNLRPVPRGGALPTADIKAKLRKLKAINYNFRNRSWLLDPNRPPVPQSSRRCLLRVRTNLPPNQRSMLWRKATLPPYRGSLLRGKANKLSI